MPGKALEVYIFMSPNCPVCKIMTLPLREIKKKYSDRDVEFFLVFQSCEKKQETEEFRNNYLITDFSIVIDRKMKLAKKFDAHVTPQAIVRNEKNMTIYTGMINDLYYDIGKKRANATHHFLDDSISSYFNEQPVPVEKTEPIGCIFR